MLNSLLSRIHTCNLNSSEIVELHFTLVDISSTNCSIEPTNPNLWSLYFDSSKSNNGAVFGYPLIDMHGNWTQLSFHLESKCLDSMSEYKVLVQGLKKSINMNVRCIEVFGDS